MKNRESALSREARPTTRQWLSLIILSLSLAIIILDASVVNVTWQWAFLINIPIGFIAIVGGLLLLDESRDGQGQLSLDAVGIFLVSVGLAAAILGLTEGQTYGWITPKETFKLGSFSWPGGGVSLSFTLLVVAIIVLVTFVWYEQTLLGRGREPLFNFSLLRYPSFRFGLFTVAVVALGEFGILFIMSLYLQGVRGLSAFETGLIVLPSAIGSFITAPLAGVLAARFGSKWIVTVGMALEALGIFLVSVVIQPTTNALAFTPIFLIYGLGLGLAIAQLTSVVLSDIPPQYYGAGSGANNTLRQVGAAIGVAVLGAVLASSLSATASAQVSKSSVIPAALKPQVQQAFDAGTAAGGEGSTLTLPSAPNAGANASAGGLPAGTFPSPAALGAAIKDIYNLATTDGTRNAARVAAFFVLLGALSSLLIPGRRATANAGEESQGKEQSTDGSAPAGADAVVVVPPSASGSNSDYN